MNEVFRFAELLERLSSGDNEPMSTVWAREFGVESDSSDFYFKLSLIVEKTERILIPISNSNLNERSKGLYSNSVNDLLPFVRPNQVFQVDRGQLVGKKQSIDLMFLASDSLPHALELDVNQLTLDALIAEIDQILLDLNDAEIDPYLKRITGAQLSSLNLALRSYGIFGAEGIAKIMGAVASELMRLSNSTDSNSAKSIYNKSFKLLKKVGAAIVWSGAVVSGAHGLIADGSALLGISDTTVEQVVLTPPD